MNPADVVFGAYLADAERAGRIERSALVGFDPDAVLGGVGRRDVHRSRAEHYLLGSVASVGGDVEPGSQHADVHLSGVYGERTCGVVGYLDVDFAFGVDLAAVIVECRGVDQPRSGIHPHAGAVGQR